MTFLSFCQLHNTIWVRLVDVRRNIPKGNKLRRHSLESITKTEKKSGNLARGAVKSKRTAVKKSSTRECRRKKRRRRPRQPAPSFIFRRRIWYKRRGFLVLSTPRKLEGESLRFYQAAAGRFRVGALIDHRFVGSSHVLRRAAGLG